jgi:hypothetical protein
LSKKKKCAGMYDSIRNKFSGKQMSNEGAGTNCQTKKKFIGTYGQRRNKCLGYKWIANVQGFIVRLETNVHDTNEEQMYRGLVPHYKQMFRDAAVTEKQMCKECNDNWGTIDAGTHQYLRVVGVEVLLVPVAEVGGILLDMGVMEPLMDIRIREDRPTGDPDRVDLGAESIVDLPRVAPELIVVDKPKKYMKTKTKWHTWCALF